MNEQQSPSRREFIRHLVRIAAAGSLLGAVGMLVAKRKETCTNNGICRGCAVLNECGLPAGLSVRQAQKRQQDHE